MADSVYRVTEVIGVSSESWEAAARNAVETAGKRDEDCAVAPVRVSGKDVCCSACATTPGTRLPRATIATRWASWNWSQSGCVAPPVRRTRR